MTPPTGQRVPLWLPLLVFALCAAGAAVLGWGAPTLALDDAYVHVATAQQLVAHGVFGIGPEHSAPASSSVLWTWLLTPFIAAGLTGMQAALALAGAVLLALLVSMSRALQGVDPLLAGTTLLFGMLAMGMPTLWVTGMEAPLQALLAVWLVGAVGAGRAGPQLAVLALLATLTRYEGVFLALVLAGWVRDRRAWWLLGGGAAGPLLYGGWCVLHGWPFVPPGVLTRSVLGPLLHGFPGPLFAGLATNLDDSAHLVAWMGLVLAWTSLTGPRLWTVAFVGCTVLQLTFGLLDAFYRYDAWLVTLGLLAVVDAVRALPRGTRWVLPAALCSLPLAARGVRALQTTPARIDATWGTTGALAQVLREAAPADVVATTTMGHLAAGGQRIVDMGCLGDREVLRLCREQRFRRATVEEVLAERAVPWVLAPQSWMSDPAIGTVPPNWTEVLRWQHPAETWVLLYSSVPRGCPSTPMGSHASRSRRRAPCTCRPGARPWRGRGPSSSCD